MLHKAYVIRLHLFVEGCMFEIVNTALLLGENVVFLEIKKCPPALLRAFVSDRYEALLWIARIISLAWYVRNSSGCEAT